jgi:hypothetical protein
MVSTPDCHAHEAAGSSPVVPHSFQLHFRNWRQSKACERESDCARSRRLYRIRHARSSSDLRRDHAMDATRYLVVGGLERMQTKPTPEAFDPLEGRHNLPLDQVWMVM